MPTDRQSLRRLIETYAAMNDGALTHLAQESPPSVAGTKNHEALIGRLRSSEEFQEQLKKIAADCHAPITLEFIPDVFGPRLHVEPTGKETFCTVISPDALASSRL